MIEQQPDGSLLVQVRLPQDGWVVGYLLSFGAEAEILDPPEMRAEVAALAKAIWEQHAK